MSNFAVHPGRRAAMREYGLPFDDERTRMTDQGAKNRRRVLGMLALLSVITYLDRVCISVAGPRMQESLHIGPVGWGWVTGAFTLSYAFFEIPSGALGDRIGPRRVLTRIVWWWSAFTSLTGAVSNYSLLLLTRFCFGIGEAGAFPNAGITIRRWFPLEKRTSAWGVVLMAGQTGGAIAPLLVLPIQMRYGWRAAFYLFGLLGVAWGIVWQRWFRDSPVEMLGIPGAPSTESVTESEHGPLPLAIGIRSANLWGVMTMAGCYGYTLFFFQSWFPTYLVKARGFTEMGLLLSSLPFIVGACANFCGGFAGDALVRRLGLKWGRRTLGLAGLGTAALSTVGAMLTEQRILALLLLSLTYGAITLQQPGVLGVCLDIGGKYSGAVTGAMNTATFLSAFISSVAYGYLVKHYGGYSAPFLPMITLLTIGALLWFMIDATREVIGRPELAENTLGTVLQAD